MAFAFAPTMLPDVVSLWRHAMEALPAERSPCRYLTPARWTETRAACLDFVDRFGAQAHQFGWTASELLGVHPEHGTLRVEACGVLMINGRRAEGVEANCVRLGNLSGYRGKPGQAFGLPIWDFAARG